MIDARDRDGRTPLHWAVAACNHEVMKFLIRSGADVCATDASGASILHYAIASTTCVQVAIENGCRADAAAQNLSTPLEFAKSRKWKEPGVIRMLEHSLEEPARLGERPPIADRDIPTVPNNRSKDFELWLIGKINEFYIVSTANIRSNLLNSQQYALTEELTWSTAKAEKETRK